MGQIENRGSMIECMPHEPAARLAPVLLVSMPQMQDPNFVRTVVLLADYTPHGAFGLVLNRQMAEPAHEVVTTDEPLTIQRDVRLFVGGPVEPTRAWVLTAERELDGDAMEVSDGVFLSASPRLICRTLELPPASGVRIVVGYAGWGPGQLDRELADSAWLLAPVEPDLIFSTPLDAMWEAAIRRLGAEPSAIQTSSGVH
jgi:putative transcriptional regulator